MRQLAARLCTDERGATGIEYGFLASLVAVALASGFDSLGNAVQEKFAFVDAEYAEATN